MPELPPYSLIELPCPKPVTKPILEDPIGAFAIEMSVVHNIIIRGINSMWTNSIVVKPGDEYAFAGYCLAGLTCIHGHHEGEEAVMFPYLQKRIDMAENYQQHKAFQGAMHTLEEYMTGVQSGKVVYDGEEARKLIEAFAEPLVEHLKDEIPTMSPERMKVFEDDIDGITEMLRRLGAHMKNQSGGSLSLPFAFGNLDVLEAPNWPGPVPRPVKWVMRTVLPWLHNSYWKFAPFTTNGVPQTYV